MSFCELLTAYIVARENESKSSNCFLLTENDIEDASTYVYIRSAINELFLIKRDQIAI